jgi:hypothetical protein
VGCVRKTHDTIHGLSTVNFSVPSDGDRAACLQAEFFVLEKKRRFSASCLKCREWFSGQMAWRLNVVETDFWSDFYKQIMKVFLAVHGSGPPLFISVFRGVSTSISFRLAT